MLFSTCAVLASCNFGKNPQNSTSGTTEATEVETTNAPTTVTTSTETETETETETDTKPSQTEPVVTDTNAADTDATEADTEASTESDTVTESKDTDAAPETTVTEDEDTVETDTDADEPTQPETDTDTEPTPPESTLPEADSKLSIKDAVALGESMDHNKYTEGKYYVTGSVKRTYANNLVIMDDEGNEITVYGAFNEDGTIKFKDMDVQPVAGDIVTVYGVIGQSNGSARIKDGFIKEFKAPAPEAGSELSIKDAITLGESMKHNEYTEGKYYVTGTIKRIYSNNIVITDDEGNDCKIITFS